MQFSSSARRLVFLTAVMAAGCGYTRERYALEASTATCQLYADCASLEVNGYDSQEGCLSAEEVALTDTADACEDWEGTAASDCVGGIAAMSCEDLVDALWPVSCDTTCAP